MNYVEVWKPTQHGQAIILQLKINKLKEKKETLGQQGFDKQQRSRG